MAIQANTNGLMARVQATSLMAIQAYNTSLMAIQA